MFCTVISLQACNCLSLSQKIKDAKPLEQKSCINGFVLSLADLFNLFWSNCDSQTKPRKTQAVVFHPEEEMGRIDTHTHKHTETKGLLWQKGCIDSLEGQSWFREKYVWEELYSVMTAKKLYNIWLQPKDWPLCFCTVVSWDTFSSVSKN